MSKNKIDIDKKYKKQKQILLDSKADLATKHKTLLFFIENDQKEILLEILRENRTVIGGLLNIYHSMLEQNQKKQTKSLTEKDGIIVETLLQFAVQHCTVGDINCSQQLNTVFRIFLSIETPFSIRKPIFASFIDIIVKLNAAKDDNLKLFMASLNYISFVKDNNIHLTGLHMSNNVPVPTSTENGVLSPKQQTFALLDIFFEKFGEQPEALYPFFKEILAYTCSDYAKDIFLDSYKQKTGFDAKSVPNDLLDCILKSLCNVNVLKGLIPLHKKLLELMMYLYDIVIGMDCIDHQIIYRTIQNYFNNFIFDTSLPLKSEEVTDEMIKSFNSNLIQKVAIVFTKNKGNEDPEVQILIQNLIKVIILALKKVNEDYIKQEIVMMVKKGTLGFIPDEIGVRTQLLVTPVIESLLIVWMSWNKDKPDEWNELKKELKFYFKHQLVVDEIQRKFNELTVVIVNKFYNIEKKDETINHEIPIHLQTLKINNINLILHDKKEERKELIREDTNVTEYIEHFSFEELLNLWNILFNLLDNISELPITAQTECCKVLLIILEYLIEAEKKSKIIDQSQGNQRIELYDIFFPYLTKVIKQKLISQEEKYLVFKSLCHLMIRQSPRITNEIYGYFISLLEEIELKEMNNKIIEELLIESYEIFSMQIPGIEKVIPKYLKFFEYYPKTYEDGNSEMKVNTLLQSIMNIIFISPNLLEQFTFEKSIAMLFHLFNLS